MTRSLPVISLRSIASRRSVISLRSVASPRSMASLGSLVLLTVLFMLQGCATSSTAYEPQGKYDCESFFIYILCVADYDMDGDVDYMYFDDTKEIFMYQPSMLPPLRRILPIHPCAIPMSGPIQDYTSELLYNDELGITQRLAIKGKLIGRFRASQPAVDACYAELKAKESGDTGEEKPFLIEDDWEEGPI